jgi:hypothetical protein
MERNFYNEATLFLEAIASGKNGIQPKQYLDDNIIGKINAKQVRLKPKTHYIRRQFTVADLSGIQDMLKDQLTDKVGINTFNGKSLSGMNYFIPIGIKIKYVEAVKETTVVNAGYTTTIPAAMKATNLIVRQSGSDILNMPFFTITDEYETDKFGYKLDRLEIFKALNTELKIDLEFPGDATILGDSVANDAFIEISFEGYQTVAVA